jgi:HPt (histidine-containing phosphotransfer) domain-containing protein
MTPKGVKYLCFIKEHRSTGLPNTNTTSDSSPTRGKRPNRKFPPKWSHLVSEYLLDLPSQIKSIRTILEIPDYPKIKKQAQRIKGTSGTYGLETISKSAAHLERSAETADPDRIITAINNITNAIAIETIRQNTKQAPPAARTRINSIPTPPAKPTSPAADREPTAHERTADA